MYRQTWRRSIQLGCTGEDVRRVQELLKEAGFDPGPIDGIFGRRTDDATKNFQRARGLQVDGIVGPKTWAALTTPSVPAGSARGRSLHIGLNVVDDAAYGMPVPVLRGCENDARDMRTLAQAQGFGAQSLLSPQATSANVVGAITEIANDLQTGDFFLLTYSGHGSQMRDPTGEEPDELDETWVLYDRQLLDDELYALWARFRPGVRIVVLSDSCHSGSVTRDVVFAYQALASSYHDSPEVGFVLDTPMGLPLQVTRDLTTISSLRDSLLQVMPDVVGELYGTTRTAVRPAEVEYHIELVLRQLQGDTRGLVLDETPQTRNLPPEIAFGDAHERQGVYRETKASARQAVPPTAPVLLMSGCQDNQLSLDGTRNGLFTQRLLEAWNQGAFNGVGYPDLHRQIVAVMPPQQTPNLFWATPTDPVLEQQRPFTI